VNEYFMFTSPLCGPREPPGYFNSAKNAGQGAFPKQQTSTTETGQGREAPGQFRFAFPKRERFT
jgi:hypothetical protein